MIYLLYQSAGETISKWTKTHISLNTAVSILAGTSRACLAFAISMCLSQGKWNWLSRSAQPLVDFYRFDAASRGAWGKIGALTAIALLAFEPFTQAVLAIRDKEGTLDHREYNKVVQSSNGSLETHGNVPTISRSTRLDAASWTGAFVGVGVVQFPEPNNKPMNFSVYCTSSNIQEDMGMKAATWNGFSPFTTRQNLKPAFACATGNCTLANFTSIAVCSKCRDISGYVTKSSGPVKLPSGVRATGPYDQSWVLGHGETLPDVSNPRPYFDWVNGRNFTFLDHEIPELNVSI
ncbi:hypothetical protein FOIG_10178 [Fusarium odoratissimum NRRL 54006]|uniref:Uncharacterized protein n=1 Tax=Fusarium odoratissimum (strain NRRL 54006) TaxID=1089451 RepID=X0J9H8_FUSO5|nr:uncharacterized protein FOIG_10178 [Fusarium odoratissimum NRRL 54006]EXL97868.1 hypothetical protein FOIG_10178 [Fusarium odoratissimum NRRL 54006]